MSETRIEWGAELTWPDGHSETRDYIDRRGAESAVDLNRTRDDLPRVAARLVRRTVVIGEWEPVEVPAPVEGPLVDLGV